MPIKIDNRNLNPGTGTGKSASGSRSTSTDFQSSIKGARLEIFDGDMRELIGIVKERGEKFLRSPEEGLLNSYKESIRLFFKKLKDEFLSLKEEFGCRKDGEQKVYQLVDTSAAEVTDLTREALSSNKAMNLLTSLDDIRGLVLDVMG
ncbi:MAG: YaaR family protein [Candidatus Riflebacteria bacterium]|nr:YaaR family protein [Candidatus Riflebacteria bacterium]